MMAEQRAAAVGIFRDHAQVRDAIAALKDADFSEDVLEILSATSQGSGTMTDTSAPPPPAGGPADGPTGGLGADVLDNPLSGVAVGGGPGVVAAGLRGYGIKEAEIQRYEEAARQGAVLVAVHAPGRYDEAEALLRRSGALRTAETDAARASALVGEDAVTPPAED